jgi:ribonuclease E
MKEALKNDRARIQVGRISSFGLMEMSRQRLRTGVLEASTKACPHCDGTGLMRTAASAGLSALRIIEDEAARGRGDRICLRAGKEAAVYVLNKKRAELADIEQRYGVWIEILIDESFEGARMTLETSGGRPVAAPRTEPAPVPEEDEDDTVEISLEGEDDEEPEDAGEEREHAAEGEGDRHGRRRRRRRRGGRGRSRREGAEGEGAEGEGAPEAEEQLQAAAEEQQARESEAAPEAAPEEEGAKRRRRRRGGKVKEAAAEQSAEPVIEPESSPMVERPVDEEPAIAQSEAADEPKPKRRRSKKAAAETEVPVVEPAPAEAPPAETADQAAPPEKPARKRRTKAKTEAEEAQPAAEQEAVSVPAANNDTAAESNGEPRRGWWQRTFG